MNKFFHLLMAAIVAFGLTACMDDYDDPKTETNDVTSPTDIGAVNYSIAQLKNDNKSLFNQTNAFEQVKTDRIIEGVVVANDEGGNLYQTLMLRHIDTTKKMGDPLRDQSIVLAVKNTWLTPYFPLGQRVKVNLKGLYIGVYSKLPKIGQPYYTSSGNLRLGPMLLQLCRTNVELVGQPDANCAELKPVALDADWIANSKNQNCMNCPQLVSVKGSLAEADGTAIFAPEELQDPGYGVDRTLKVAGSKSKMTLRTSTQNNIAFTVMPQGERTFTGMLSYYSGWQIQLRSVNDINK